MSADRRSLYPAERGSYNGGPAHAAPQRVWSRRGGDARVAFCYAWATAGCSPGHAGWRAL